MIWRMKGKSNQFICWKNVLLLYAVISYQLAKLAVVKLGLALILRQTKPPVQEDHQTAEQKPNQVSALLN